MSDPRRIEVGRLGAPHGVRGWLRVQSFTEPPQRLFEWRDWRLEREGGSPGEVQAIDVKVLEARQLGNGWIARIAGVDERDAASRLSGHMILVDRAALPPTSGREHYRSDLVGFEARNLEGALLGVVEHFVDTPGNVVMVIKGARQHLVPVTSQHLREVRVDARTLVVDWPEDF